MSQKSSLPQPTQSVSRVLTADSSNKRLFINTLRPHRFQARKLASTLDERGPWGAVGCGCDVRQTARRKARPDAVPVR